MITGTHVKPGDIIVGFRSSGVHSNGISLVRKVLFKQWGGKYEPDAVPEGLTRKIVEEVLEPTKIYVKPFLRLAEQFEVKGAVHVTGDAYLKFGRLSKFSPNIGFEFNNFKPQPIFNLIQTASRTLGSPITDEEMFKTFNMGWGFAAILNKLDVDDAIDVLEKARSEAAQIGQVTASEGIRILYKNQKIRLN
jgi:phosphoribosylformylglycinamidine cyclo-ligase